MLVNQLIHPGVMKACNSLQLCSVTLCSCITQASGAEVWAYLPAAVTSGEYTGGSGQHLCNEC